MTTQPERPYATDDEYDEDIGPTASSASAGEYGNEQTAVIVAEVIDEEPVSRAGDEPETTAGSEPGFAGGASAANATSPAAGLSAGTEPSPVAAPADQAAEPGNGSLGQEWHDIQAMFVDDPRGSVQLAAEAADAAVNSLVESLRERQTGLWPGAGSAGSANPSDTEQLRETLRQYRMFCAAVRDLGARLPQVSGR